MVTAFLLISAELRSVNALALALAELRAVSEVYSTTGDDDLVVVLRVRDLDMLAQVITEEIAGLHRIRATRTDVALRVYSRHDLESLWDVGTE